MRSGALPECPVGRVRRAVGRSGRSAGPVRRAPGRSRVRLRPVAARSARRVRRATGRVRAATGQVRAANGQVRAATGRLTGSAAAGRAGIGAGPGPSRLDERGAGTVLVLGGIGLLLAVAVAASLVGGVLLVRTRAAAAADLAALAGATSALSGEQEACSQAARVAQANGVRLDSCVLRDVQLWVEVSMPTPDGLRRIVSLPGRARARAHAELVATERDP